MRTMNHLAGGSIALINGPRLLLADEPTGSLDRRSADELTDLLLGLNESEGEAYAREVVKADFEEPGDDDVLQKVLADLQGKGVETSEHLLRKHMDELMEVAVEQVQTDG